VPVNEALFSVKTNDKQSIGHPLIENARKLLPSVTRVFSASRDVYVYLEAYEQYATPTQPLVAYATLYQRRRRKHSRPSRWRWPVDSIARRSPCRSASAFPIDRVPSGRYDCQVTVIDPASGKAAFWQTAIAIVP
jgi:hypothetical protein